MDAIVEELQEELTCATTIKVPILEKIPLIGTDGISESVVVTWIIMAVLILFAFIMTRNLKVHNISKRQAVIELLVTKTTGMVEGMVGTEAKRYVTYLTTVLIYIVIANVCGIFGFKSPTKDLNVTTGFYKNLTQLLWFMVTFICMICVKNELENIMKLRS